MTLTANFSKGSSAKFVGNATLDGILTHSLEGHTEQLNVSQLLPLEASNLWEQRESKLHKYLQSFQGMVMILSKEKIISCE